MSCCRSANLRRWCSQWPVATDYGPVDEDLAIRLAGAPLDAREVLDLHGTRLHRVEAGVEEVVLDYYATIEEHAGPARQELVDLILRDPVSIDVAPRNAAAAPARQVIHPVDRDQKRHLLTYLLRKGDIDRVLVFTSTKRGANRLAEQLGRDGIRAAAIHGNKSQSQRVRALAAFKSGHSQVLVATDIAARGLDIESLSHVVNFELPNVPEDYVHRIGRTSRAGLRGTAISLVAVEEQELIQAIERLL